MKKGIKPINPKDAAAINKLPLHLVSPLLKAYLCMSQFLGLVKYGAWNWRCSNTTLSIYWAALQRHLDKWWSGEENDADGTPHLANALACLAIIIEGTYIKNMKDDRPPSIDLGPLYKKLEAMMPIIKEKFGDYNPRHFTIQDQVPGQVPRIDVDEHLHGKRKPLRRRNETARVAKIPASARRRVARAIQKRA